MRMNTAAGKLEKYYDERVASSYLCGAERNEEREQATHETPAAAGDYTLRTLLLAESQSLH